MSAPTDRILREVLAWDGRTFAIGDRVSLRGIGYKGTVAYCVSAAIVGVNWDQLSNRGPSESRIADLDKEEPC